MEQDEQNNEQIFTGSPRNPGQACGAAMIGELDKIMPSDKILLVKQFAKEKLNKEIVLKKTDCDYIFH